MTSLEEFKNKLSEIMTIKKELAPGTGAAGTVLFQEEDDETTSDPDMDTLNKLDQETQDETGDENGDNNASDGEDTNNQEEDSKEENNDPAPQPQEQPQQNDNQKVQQMFKDTGNPDLDYSLTNENNVRMYKFKFTYAGINVDDLMKSEEEKCGGLSRKELESRLSPEQLHYYNEKWQKLRDKFPQIAQREKNVCVYNANIMLFINDKSGKEVPLSENRRTEAYKKIVIMMDKKFGDTWQDKPEALNFLKNIKINFSKDKPVRNNLLSVNVLQEKDGITGSSLVPFNKIYIDVPSSVQNFLRINQEMGLYNDSSIYQSLSSDFKEGGKSVGSMDAIIKGSSNIEDDESENSDSDEGSDDGGSGGGGDFSGLGDSGGDMGDISTDNTDTEKGDDEGNNTSDDSGGEDNTEDVL